jgi:hypothetical protein
MVRIKGLSVIDARAYIADKFGPDANDKVRAAMKKEEGDAYYAPDILPVSWVGVDVVVNHLIVFDKVFGYGDGKAGDALIRHIGNKHFKGIYSIMFKGMPPKEVVKKISLIWDRYYDKGASVLESVEENSALVKIINCPELPLHHEKLPVPYMEEILSLAGAKNATIRHTQCVATGAEYCILKYRWG